MWNVGQTIIHVSKLNDKLDDAESATEMSAKSHVDKARTKHADSHTDNELARTPREFPMPTTRTRNFTLVSDSSLTHRSRRQRAVPEEQKCAYSPRAKPPLAGLPSGLIRKPRFGEGIAAFSAFVFACEQKGINRQQRLQSSLEHPRLASRQVGSLFDRYSKARMPEKKLAADVICGPAEVAE